MYEKVNRALENLKKAMDEEVVDPTQGLPQELFVFATTLFPCPNIDLFITRGNNLLLTWRDDEFYGKGWHIPGGCLRLKESLEHRVQQTALNEIGTEVIYDKDHFITREAMVKEYRSELNNQLERCHNISMLFYCQLPCEFEPIISKRKMPFRGDLKWFAHTPENLLEAHRILYGDIIDKFFKENRE